MPVTLAQARTEVRALLDESSPAFWTDAQLNSWINQGCEDVARRAEVLWEEVNLSITPLVQNYNFPANYLRAHRAEFSPTNSDQTYSLEFHAINEMDAIWGILHALPQAWPQYFTVRGNSTMGWYLMLYPSPGQSGVLTVYYYRQANTITNDNTAIDTFPGWENVIYDYAVYKAQRKARDPLWQQAYNLYEKNLGEMVDKSRNMTDLANQITSGITNWPVYAYGSSDSTW